MMNPTNPFKNADAAPHAAETGPDTGPGADRRPERELRDRLLALAEDPSGIEARLAELDLEWDVERVLEANALFASLLGTGLAFARRRRLVASLPASVALAVLGLALERARPPLAVLRRLGFRTADEIARERAALLALHGGLPFAPPPRPDLGTAALRALRRRIRR